MDCISTYAADLLFMALVLAVFAIAGLAYSTVAARRAALGSALLDACAGSYEVALLAVENVRGEHELLGAAVRREHRRGRL